MGPKCTNGGRDTNLHKRCTVTSHQQSYRGLASDKYNRDHYNSDCSSSQSLTRFLAATSKWAILSSHCFMIFVALISACYTDCCRQFEIILAFRETCNAGVQCLSFDVTLEGKSNVTNHFLGISLRILRKLPRYSGKCLLKVSKMLKNAASQDPGISQTKTNLVIGAGVLI